MRAGPGFHPGDHQAGLSVSSKQQKQQQQLHQKMPLSTRWRPTWHSSTPTTTHGYGRECNKNADISSNPKLVVQRRSQSYILIIVCILFLVDGSAAFHVVHNNNGFTFRRTIIKSTRIENNVDGLWVDDATTTRIRSRMRIFVFNGGSKSAMILRPRCHVLNQGSCFPLSRTKHRLSVQDIPYLTGRNDNRSTTTTTTTTRRKCISPQRLLPMRQCITTCSVASRLYMTNSSSFASSSFDEDSNSDAGDNSISNAAELINSSKCYKNDWKSRWLLLRFLKLRRIKHLPRLGCYSTDNATEDTNSQQNKKRPNWSCDWMPTSLITIHPILQLLIAILLYIFHLKVLTQHAIPYPIQLIPNNRGYFQSIGLETLAGMISLAGLLLLRLVTKDKEYPAVPSVLSEPYNENVPWSSIVTLRSKVHHYHRVRRHTRKMITARHEGTFEGDSSSDNGVGVKAPKESNPSIVDKKDRMMLQHRLAKKHEQKIKQTYQDISSSSIRTAFWLLIAYTATGRFALAVESMLCVLAGLGVPMTVAMHRSLVVLLGHLCWVGIGCLILRCELTPAFFGSRPPKRHLFPGGKRRTDRTEKDPAWQSIRNRDKSSSDNVNDSAITFTKDQSKLPISKQMLRNRRRTKWYQIQWNTYWMWWTIGGYFVSCWVFNIADMINQYVLPSSIFEEAAEGVVSQLINPENNDLLASIVGYIAPCCSAPVWEEILYRGYMLPSLCLYMPFWAAVIISGIIFAAHHMSATGFIPLMMLGMTWAALYGKCQNLLVPIFIHAMWNSRVFLGSWLGL